MDILKSILILLGCGLFLALPAIALYFLFALASWLICLAFSLSWNWLIPFAIVAFAYLVRWIYKTAIKDNNE